MAFYKDLFAFMGWQTLEDSPVEFGIGPDIFNSLWFNTGANDACNDYDGAGMNHIGLLVQTQVRSMQSSPTCMSDIYRLYLIPRATVQNLR